MVALERKLTLHSRLDNIQRVHHQRGHDTGAQPGHGLNQSGRQTPMAVVVHVEKVVMWAEEEAKKRPGLHCWIEDHESRNAGFWLALWRNRNHGWEVGDLLLMYLLGRYGGAKSSQISGQLVQNLLFPFPGAGRLALEPQGTSVESATLERGFWSSSITCTLLSTTWTTWTTSILGYGRHSRCS